jgi:hypothetical protein
MIGFNGGLIGGLATARNTSSDPSVPGVWTLPEQRNAKLANTWPTAGAKLLDTYTGASVAYSLRLLRTAYSGSLVTVRRQSDNVEQGFTEAQIIGSGAGSLADFCSGTNGFVKTWHDQSGNGNNATQSTSANQPQIVTSSVVELTNTKPCIRYAASDDRWLTFDTRLTNVISTFQVCKLDTTDGVKFLLGDTTTFDYHGGGATWLDASLSATEVRNGSNRINNAISTLQSTNKSTSQVLISMINTGNTEVSAIARDRTEAGRNWRGTFQELIIYNSSKSSDASAINSSINLHYSIYV